MSYEDSNDEEVWYADDDDGADEEDAAPCPECGGPIQAVADKCPSCGYWLSSKDRYAMWPGMRKPLWLRATAWIVLAAFLFSLLAAAVALF